MRAPATDAGGAAGRLFVRAGLLAPALFVFLWSTGYVVARLGMPHAPPLGFLSMRFALAVLVLGAMALAARARWPSRAQALHLVVCGLLIQAAYLSGVWCAVKLGMPAGVSALIVNLQPVLTAAAAPWVGERTSPRQWLGLGLGFAGVAMVVATKTSAQGITAATLALSLFSLLAITGGTLYQKRFCPAFDLRTGSLIQYAASFVAVLPFALWLEADAAWSWNAELAFAMGWSVLVLSVGAIFLMFTLIRRGEAARVASLFYLVPPVTAALAWALFDERFALPALAGLVLAAVGVALVQRR